MQLDITPAWIIQFNSPPATQTVIRDFAYCPTIVSFGRVFGGRSILFMEICYRYLRR